MRKVARVTPLIEAWQLFVALAFFAITQGRRGIVDAAVAVQSSSLVGSHQVAMAAVAVGAAVVIAFAAWLLSGIWWRARGYSLDGEEIVLKFGVLSKEQRVARYDRIQAIDIVEPLLARLFGLAAVHVETAGGEDSRLEIKYLTRADADALKREILGVTADTHIDAATAAATTDVAIDASTADTASTADAAVIPMKRSLIAAACTLSTVVGAVWLIVSFAVGQWVSAFAAVSMVAGAGWKIVNGSWLYRYRVVRVDGRPALSVEYGLSTRTSKNVRLDKIRGVQITQPVLWRLLGWWRVEVSVAGYGVLDDAPVVLPVGQWDDVVDVLGLVAPGVRVEPTPPPRVADEDYLGSGDGGAEPAGGFMRRGAVGVYQCPPVARRFGPVHARVLRLVFGGEDAASVLYKGWLRRKISIVKPADVQEVSVTRGPVSRVLGIGTVRFDLVEGPTSFEVDDLLWEDAVGIATVMRGRCLDQLASP